MNAMPSTYLDFRIAMLRRNINMREIADDLDTSRQNVRGTVLLWYQTGKEPATQLGQRILQEISSRLSQPSTAQTSVSVG